MCYALPCSLSLHCKSRRRVDCFSVTSSKEGTLCELSVGGAQREEFSFEFLPFFAAELRWQVLMECDWETFVLLLTSLPLACAGLELWVPESGGTGMGLLLLIYFPAVIQNPPQSIIQKTKNSLFYQPILDTDYPVQPQPGNKLPCILYTHISYCLFLPNIDWPHFKSTCDSVYTCNHMTISWCSASTLALECLRVKEKA